MNQKQIILPLLCFFVFLVGCDIMNNAFQTQFVNEGPGQMLPPPDVNETSKEVAGIIISIRYDLTYDPLFSSVRQQSKQGTRVLTYLTTSQNEETLYEALQGNFTNADPELRTLAGQIQTLTVKCPSCIVLNWECSSGFNGQIFWSDGKYVFKLVNLAIIRGYMTMFSDFSLKALINQWDAEVLGPNPFVKVDDTDTAIQLKFEKIRLLQSPSSQLQTVARLAASEQLHVNVLGGTIVYGVDSRVQPRQKYQLEVLTIASNFPAPQPYLQSRVGNSSGLAGHVLLNYKEGGKVLTSMGHWIELMKIDTTEENLFATAETIYGAAYASQVRSEYSSLNAEDKVGYLSTASINYIQNQSPGSNNALVGGKKLL